MIHDSSPWKAELARDADLIERWAAKPVMSERRSFLFERKVFLAAYALRKLDEAARVSTDLLMQSIGVTQFAPSRAGFSAGTSHRWDDYFDLEGPVGHSLPCRRLINVLIHSLVFVEVLNDDDTIGGFMVTSDRESERGLYQVQLPDFVKVMRAAAADYPTHMHRVFDPGTEKWIIWAGYGVPPAAMRKRFEQAHANLLRMIEEEHPTG